MGRQASIAAKSSKEQDASEASQTTAKARRDGMVRRKDRHQAVVSSQHILRELAAQLNETYANSGMTLEQLFTTFEKDGDGKISKEEFSRMMATLGAEIPAHTMDHLFTVLDADAGGEIELSEFIAWTRNELSLHAEITKYDLESTTEGGP